MNIFDEDLKNLETLQGKKSKKVKNKSPIKWIIISIVLLTIILFVILGLIIYLQKNLLSVKIDGTSQNTVADLIYFDEEDASKIYYPIRKMAKYFKYEDYAGDYPNLSEDKNKCYVRGSTGITVFTNDSNQIKKYVTTSEKNVEERVYDLENKVKAVNGELYVTKDGIEKAFDTYVIYNSANNEINIQTLTYLAGQYATYVIKNYKYAGIKSDSDNIYTIEDNMLIVENSTQTSYGVYDIKTKKLILENKYDDINYLINTKDFLIKTNGKYGVVTKTGETLIEPVYEEIGILSNSHELYYVKKDGKYGILDTKGKQILYPEYNGIGINNLNSFEYTDNCTKYVLLDNLIPIMKDNKYAFYNIKDKKIVSLTDGTGYTGVGCISSKKDTKNVLVIPEANVLVVAVDKLYTIIDSSGKDVLEGGKVGTVYAVTNSSGTTYYMTNVSGEKEANAIELLRTTGIITK